MPNLIGSKKCIAFPAFADAYNQFAEFVKIDITQDVGPGWTGRETMHFVDPDGRHVQVEFSLNKMQASVIVDGEVLDRFGSSDEGAVEKWVTRLVDPVYRSRRDQEGFTFRPRF
ncbi:hypothetical protein LP421_08435 [Rhizobium sp. RCAM05350]|nr:hypothetical protein LP421_08435 [Rhizobium sp. RCAM05350]